MSPLICETVTGRSMAELLAARDAVVHADLVELRLDGVTDLDVAGALSGRRLPAVVTVRPVWEGGRFDDGEEVRRSLLRGALDAGAEFVDVEWKAGMDELVREHSTRVVLSMHDFDGVPHDLAARVRDMRALAPALVKVAVMPSRLAQLASLRDVASGGPSVVIGMGGTGLPSRLLAAHMGSRWSYAGAGVAPGQMPSSRMVDEFRFRQVTSRTALYGVVGNNVLHSLSPAMHNAAFTAAGLDAVYVPLLPSDFADFVAFAETFGLRGASVTIPFKIDALRLADEVDARTRLIGAANTLKRNGAVWAATNTDVDGFLAPLLEAWSGTLAGARVSVLGAGGAARAAVVGLREHGARVRVHARRRDRAERLAEVFDVGAGPWPPVKDSWDVLVNCTPAGSASSPNESPLSGQALGGSLVYDLVYRSPADGEAPLVQAARRAGCVVLDGLPMLVAQAERQFEYWTGHRPPAGVMASSIGARSLGPRGA